MYVGPQHTTAHAMTLKAEGLHPRANSTQPQARRPAVRPVTKKTPPFADSAQNGAPEKGKAKDPAFRKQRSLLRPFLRQGREGKQDGAPEKAKAQAQSRAMWVLVRPTPSIA